MDEPKKAKRRVKQLYFGKRDNRLWDWLQSMPDGEGNAAICQILNHYLFGGIKPEIPSYLDGSEFAHFPRLVDKPQVPAKKVSEFDDDLLK